jgi:hypothetical protein
MSPDGGVERRDGGAMGCEAATGAECADELSRTRRWPGRKPQYQESGFTSQNSEYRNQDSIPLCLLLRDFRFIRLT